MVLIYSASTNHLSNDTRPAHTGQRIVIHLATSCHLVLRRIVLFCHQWNQKSMSQRTLAHTCANIKYFIYIRTEGQTPCANKES